MVDATKFFNKKEIKIIVDAIRKAEDLTSGEIHVHLESVCKENILDRAAYFFKKLKMHKTQLRNGVLFYIALENKRFAVLGDCGINEKVPKTFWEKIKQVLHKNFTEEHFCEGLVEGIILCGKQLKKHFPKLAEDKNEITDELSFEDN